MRSFARDDDGQAIVLLALVMLALLFAMGLGMDTGQLYNGRRTGQEAADAAAFAGATVFYQGGTASQAISAATADASLNGYSTNTPTSGTTVTVSSPPTSGSRAGDTTCVQVDITTPVRTSLVPQQAGFTTVATHATGCAATGGNPYALMAIDQSCDSNALNVGSPLTIHGGSIQVNSCTPRTGYSANDAGTTVTLDTGFVTRVVGNATGTWPGLVTGAGVQPDPFAGTAKPSTNGLSDQGTPSCSSSGSIVINQPGLYTGTANSNCLYVFAPGTYIFKGGALQLSGHDAQACTGSNVSTTSSDTVSVGTQTVTPASMTNITAGKMLLIDSSGNKEGVVPSAVTDTTFTAIFAKTHSGSWTIKGGCTAVVNWATPPSTTDGGVFFFFTGPNYPSTGGNCPNPSFKLAGSVDSVLTAPTSGTYKGMLVWQDQCTRDITIGGSGSILTSGSLYAPNATVSGGGSGSSVTVSNIVAYKVDTGQATFTMNYNSALNFQTQVPALVE